MRTQGNKKETVTQHPITYYIELKINSSEVLPEHCWTWNVTGYIGGEGKKGRRAEAEESEEWDACTE